MYAATWVNATSVTQMVKRENHKRYDETKQMT